MGYSTLLNSSALQNTIISIYQFKNIYFISEVKCKMGKPHQISHFYYVNVNEKQEIYIYIYHLVFHKHWHNKK